MPKCPKLLIRSETSLQADICRNTECRRLRLHNNAVEQAGNETKYLDWIKQREGFESKFISFEWLRATSFEPRAKARSSRLAARSFLLFHQLQLLDDILSTSQF